MEIALLFVGLLALIPVWFFIYDRVFRLKHNIKIEHANVTLIRGISDDASRNERLALLIHDLKLVNSGSTAMTPASVALEYTCAGGKNLLAHPYMIPVGVIEGFGESIAMTNGTDTLVVRWKDINTALSKRSVLNPGELLSGSVLFLLDVALNIFRDLKDFTIVVKDYSGNETRHTNNPQESWYHSSEKGMTVVDAPIRKVGENIIWDGVTLGIRKPH